MRKVEENSTKKLVASFQNLCNENGASSKNRSKENRCNSQKHFENENRTIFRRFAKTRFSVDILPLFTIFTKIFSKKMQKIFSFLVKSAFFI
ncbi:MAG: hypothetical protein ACI4QH_05405 [Candidatus Fimimonas sp.]